MAPSIICNDAIQGEVFLPGQIFIFGGFALWANLPGHLEQIDSYAPGHQVRFGSLNYTADIRGNLIFDGFEPMTGAPNSHDEHDLDRPSDGAREITPASSPTLNLEQIVPSEDGWMDPATEAAHSAAKSRILTSPPMRPVLPDPWIRPRPWAPNRLRPCLSNLIGH